MIVIAASSCAGNSYEAFIAPGHEGAPAARTLLVAPMNFDSALPDHLLEAAELAHRGVIAYLGDAGRNVATVRLSEIGPVWKLSARSVGGIADGGGRPDMERWEAALGELARRLAATRELDAVVLPSLIIRAARYHGTRVLWDGVSRGQGIDFSEGPEGFRPEKMTGNVEALSLWLRVFSASGEKIFENFGGLEPLTRPKVVGRRFYVEPRGDLLMDSAVLRDGIGVAFAPYLPEPATDGK